MTRLVFVLFVAFGGIAALLAQMPATSAPQPLWTMNTGLARPNSAYYHQQSNSIFVSNHSGGRFNKDGNGYITRLAPDGTVLAEKWATGLNAPKGIGSVGSTIWVVDVEEIVGFEMTAGGGRPRPRVRIDGARALNDLATAPDGTIFVSESWRYPAPPDNPPRIYMIKDGKPSIFVEGDDAGWLPTGLLIDGPRLIVGTTGRGIGKDARIQGGQLLAFDLKTRARTVLATTSAVGQVSGIEPAESGAYFVSDLLSRKLLHVARDGKVTTLVRFDHGSGDIAVSPMGEQLQQAGTLFVPFPLADSVSAYDLSTLIRAATN
jgi:hypothetical protein